MSGLKSFSVAFALCFYLTCAQVAPTMEPEMSPDATPAPPICFPGTATVELASGARKTMADLTVGDLVKVAPGKFSEVFMFTHKLSDVQHRFVTLYTQSGAKISLTGGHYLYVAGNLVAARTVRVGDTVELADGSFSRVERVEADVLQGLYNPQTVHGDVIVDGVRASTYTTAVAPQFAHAALSPLRAVYESLGLSSNLFDNGARLLASLTPKGENVVA